MCTCASLVSCVLHVHVQVYLEFDTKSAESGDDIRNRLQRMLGNRPTTALKRGKSGGALTFFDAFQSLVGKDADRAWTDAQLRLIQERCDELEACLTELGEYRHDTLPLLQEQQDAIGQQEQVRLQLHMRMGMWACAWACGRWARASG